jgi:hypothetical protein
LRLLQAKDHSFLLLDDLAQILVGDAELVQLPIEPRDFFVLLLEGCLRPLECGALLLKEALGLFSRSRASRALEGRFAPPGAERPSVGVRPAPAEACPPSREGGGLVR